MKKKNYLTSGIWVLVILLSLSLTSALISAEGTGPFASNFIAPEGAGGVYTENADGSISYTTTESWNEYRLYKHPVESVDGSYTMEMSYMGGFPGWGSIGFAVGIEDLSHFIFGGNPDNVTDSKGLVVRLQNQGEWYAAVPGGRTKDGSWIWVNANNVILTADYSATTEYTLKIVVEDTEDEGYKKASVYFNSDRILSNVTFEVSGPYVAIIGQQTSGTTITNIKINDAVVAGVDYVSPISENPTAAAPTPTVSATESPAETEAPGDVAPIATVIALLTSMLFVVVFMKKRISVN